MAFKSKPETTAANNFFDGPTGYQLTKEIRNWYNKMLTNYIFLYTYYIEFSYHDLTIK